MVILISVVLSGHGPTAYTHHLTPPPANATLAVIAEAFEQISAHHAVQVVAGWADNRTELLTRAERAHRTLIDLIEQGNGEQAETFWRRHMRIVRGLLFDHGHNETLIDILD